MGAGEEGSGVSDTTNSYKIRNVYHCSKLVFDYSKPTLDLKIGIVVFFFKKLPAFP